MIREAVPADLPEILHLVQALADYEREPDVVEATVDDFARAREGRFTLVQLLQGILARAELVVTFIAVLEMTKLGLLRIAVEEGTEPAPPGEEDLPLIWVHRTPKDLGVDIMDDYR